MFDDLTRITLEDLRTKPAPISPEEEIRHVSQGAMLGLATLFGPIAMLAIVMSITGNLHLAGALCFFTYAQLSHAMAARRALKRKQQLLELFRIDQQRREPTVPAGEVEATLGRFSRLHGRTTLFEMIGNPVGAIVLAGTELAHLMSDNAELLRVLVFTTPFVLIGSLAMVLISLRQLDRLQTATFATPDTLTL